MASNREMKFLLAAVLAPALCLGAIWPDNVGAWKRAATMQAALSDRPIWDEFGLKESEAARYENGGASFTVTGYRLQDTTGAMAAFDWQRPAKSTVSQLAPLAADIERVREMIRQPTAVDFEPDLDGEEAVERRPQARRRSKGTALKSS